MRPCAKGCAPPGRKPERQPVADWPREWMPSVFTTPEAPPHRGSGCAHRNHPAPSRSTPSRAHSRWLAWLSRLWPSWQQALEFVQPRTVTTWQKKRFRYYWRRLSQSGKPGRPAVSKEVRELIQDMWRSNPTWGSPRIIGELQNLASMSPNQRSRPRPTKPLSPMQLHPPPGHRVPPTDAGISSSPDHLNCPV